MLFSNRLLSFYSILVWKFSSINLIISSFVIICFLDIFPFFIFFNLILLPALLNTTVTSSPAIPMSRWYSMPGISRYSFIPNEKLFSLICLFFTKLSTAANNLLNNSSLPFLIVTTAPTSSPGLTSKDGILLLDFILAGFLLVIKLRSLNPFSSFSAIPLTFKTTFSILIFLIAFSECDRRDSVPVIAFSSELFLIIFCSFVILLPLFV